MRIAFERSGGIAGMRLAVTVDSAGLPPAQAECLRRLLSAGSGDGWTHGAEAGPGTRGSAPNVPPGAEDATATDRVAKEEKVGSASSSSPIREERRIGRTVSQGGRDRFLYRLTVGIAEKPLVLDIDEDGMDEPVRALVVWLTEEARRSKGE